MSLFKSYSHSTAKSKRLKKLLLSLIFVCLVGIIWVGVQVFPLNSGTSVKVSIPSGSSGTQAINLLFQSKVISSPLLFKAFAEADGVDFTAGTFVFKKHDSYLNVINVLRRPPTWQKLVIPDGWTLSQIAQAVGKLKGHSAAKFLAAANSGKIRSPYEPAGINNLQGLLYPDTYFIDPQESNKKILLTMVNKFIQQANKVGLSHSQKMVGVSPYQAVIIASIIEKEALRLQDGPKVARVIYNRLHKNMPLQIDATVHFATGNYKPLTYQDLTVSSAYNTYIHKGLPPGPISTPSLAAIEDALSPASGPWLYYVVVGKNGKEAFSVHYNQQLANSALAQKAGAGA